MKSFLDTKLTDTNMNLNIIVTVQYISCPISNVKIIMLIAIKSSRYSQSVPRISTTNLNNDIKFRITHSNTYISPYVSEVFA